MASRIPGQIPPLRTNPIAPGDAGFTKGGTAAGWYSIGGGIYGTGLYTYGSNSTRDDWGRWSFDLTKLNGGGVYRVEAYATSTHAGHGAADYHINASGGIQHKLLNQKPSLTSGWTLAHTLWIRARHGWSWTTRRRCLGQTQSTTKSASTA